MAEPLTLKFEGATPGHASGTPRIGTPPPLAPSRASDPPNPSPPPPGHPSPQAFPDRHLTVMLFKDVTNSAEIHKKLLDRTLEPEVALLDPAPIQSLFALHLAAHKAPSTTREAPLTTRTIHSEVVYNMSASKHITEGLRRFGMDDDASAVLACRFDATADDVAATKANVRGGRSCRAENSRRRSRR